MLQSEWAPAGSCLSCPGPEQGPQQMSVEVVGVLGLREP